MRVSVQTILPRISKLTSVLNGAWETVTIDGKVHTFSRSRRYYSYNHRLGLLHPLSNISHHNCFSTRTVAFENQPLSWLFVSDTVAGAYGAQVNLEIDLDERLKGVLLEKLKTNLKMRGMQLDIDTLVKSFWELCACEKRKEELHAEKFRILEERKLLKDKDPSEDLILSLKNLQESLSEVKKEINNLQAFGEFENKVMYTALKLPNDLHDSTPVQDDLVIKEIKGHIDCPSTTQSHVEIAKKFNLIKFSNVGPKAYYLKGKLVLAEMALISTACSYLESKKYRHMAGPEFFKTPIMEGCGLDVHNPDEVLTMLNISKDFIEPMSHLAGVSLPKFAAFVAKTCIGDNILPFNMFACGRCYQNGDLPGLYGATQSTQTSLFSCAKVENLDSRFHETVDIIWNFLEPLGFPLRLLQICARGLRREERRRFEVQMFSPVTKILFRSKLQVPLKSQGLPEWQWTLVIRKASLHIMTMSEFIADKKRTYYLKVAHVSDLSDFVSRRLMITHNQNHADIRKADHLHMVSGTLINITSLLAIWMEYSNTDQTIFTKAPAYEDQRELTRLSTVPLQDKLLRDVSSLKLTTGFFEHIQVET